MSVEAYILNGQVRIPIIVPDKELCRVASELGIPETDLFCIDHPSGMSRWTSAKVVIPESMISTLYENNGIGLELHINDGRNQLLANDIVWTGMIAMPHQPLQWRQDGGVALVELVDARYYWQFTAGNIEKYINAWSSDGRWISDNDPGLELSNIITQLEAYANTCNLGLIPSGFTSAIPATVKTRLLSDLFTYQGVSIGVLYDAIAAMNGQVIISDGSFTVYNSLSTLYQSYSSKMNSAKAAMAGGSQPAGASASVDLMVTKFIATGWQNRAPLKAVVTTPSRSVEGQTTYSNQNFQAIGVSYPTSTMVRDQIAGASSTSITTRPTTNVGIACLPSSAITVMNAAATTPLTTAPGWAVADAETWIKGLYESRNRYVPFGKTSWSGWMTQYAIGQNGNISYRISVGDSETKVYCITSTDRNDWRYGYPGTALCNPSEIISGKGMAAVYRSAIGSTIIDVAPPSTRVFLAKITAYATTQTAWRWDYTFVEVEPQGGTTNANAYSSIGQYARSGTAYNFAEHYNNSASQRISPGIYDSQVQNATIAPLPIDVDMLVMMCEHSPPANWVDGAQSTNPTPIKFWFSMPNAIVVTCETPPPQ